MTDPKNWFEKILDKVNSVDDVKIQPKSVPKTMSDFPEYVFGELKESLKEHIYRKKTGEIVSPPRITVFWSEENEKKWRGAKRRALVEDLESVVMEIIGEMTGTVSTETPARTVDIGLEADMMIRDNTVRLESYWDDAVEPVSETVTEVRAPFRQTQILPDDDEKTNLTGISDDEEITSVIAAKPQRFSVEVWHLGEKQTERSFSQNKINIGRDSQSKGKVDLNLSDDSRIARHHAVLQIDESGNFWITAVGDSPLSVDDFLVPQDKSVQVKENQEIRIIDFTLRLKNDKKL